MSFINPAKVFVQSLPYTKAIQKGIELSILRLDELHPVISGNKWYKLKLYLQDAIDKKKDTIATFGGAYSNHIVAAAEACKQSNLQSIGIIRGEESAQLSHTLQQAKDAGMQLIFVSREAYKNKEALKQLYAKDTIYWVNEGGTGILGAEGAKEIMRLIDEKFTHIICATGTGTMMAGLIKGSLPHQKIMGINALKHATLQDEMEMMLTNEEKRKQYEIINNYHFGGYAKQTKEQYEYMNELWQAYQLPTDIIYTSKMMFATMDLIEKGIFPEGSKIIAIHSGGLQGNLSLPANILQF